MITQQNVCKRCLLREMAGMDDVLSQVERTRELMTDSERATDESYKSRLSECMSCDSLLNATCQKCGCYVEIRALAKTAHCPVRKW